METVLARIVADKIDWVGQQKESFPLSSFQSQVIASDRSFYDALAGVPAKFILECKKASPSKGMIRKDFNLNEIAQVYGQYAAVISVLTDEKYFQGHFTFLPQVRAQVECPILCKDFIIDSYQVYLARYYQADAILLMLSVLNDDEYRVLSALAHQLNMGVLTEVSNFDEAERAVALDAKVIGINNRNLRDLSIALERTKEIAPLLPKDRIVISESGIYTHKDVRDLSQFANGFLIGSALMAATDLDRAVRRVIFGDNKVCGLTRPQDAKVVYQVGANWGGLIFVEHSPRCVTLEQAQQIIQAAPLQYVGVFQNQPIETIMNCVALLALSAIQLHGDEDAKYIELLRLKLPESIEIWKAYGMSDEVPEFTLNTDRYLLDTQFDGQMGGTGRVFDWALIPEMQKSKMMLAGGLSPRNVAAAAAISCLGLDLNSGVESGKGVKDEKKLIAAFSAIRAYSRTNS